MNHTGRIQRVRVTVNDEAAFPENIFEEIESSLLGIEVDKVENDFCRVYKCSYTVNLESIIDSVLDGIIQKGEQYWTRILPVLTQTTESDIFSSEDTRAEKNFSSAAFASE
jgi:hypothetical protein